MPNHVYRYPTVRPAEPHELRAARRARLRAAAATRAQARARAAAPPSSSSHRAA